MGGFFFISIFDEQIKLKNMCITNKDCQEGFRCENESGQCVPSNGSGDPIKPPIGSLRLPSENPEKEEES